MACNINPETGSMRNATMISLLNSLYDKNRETKEHAVRLRSTCVKMGEALCFSQDELNEIALLALLHDIGKMDIPEHILMKPAKLTVEEYEIIKTHTDIGYRIAMSYPELAHIADGIRSHHERYDGNGYPQGLKGEDIPRMSRIISITDSFDAMTHDRPYKTAISKEEAINELKRCAGKQFDPGMVDVFLTILREVGLSNQFVIYSWKSCKEMIEELLLELNIQADTKDYFEIKLILTEALTNAFKHGNKRCEDKPIYLKYTYDGTSIRFEIEDSGNGFKDVALPRMIPDESLLNDNGRGLFLINSIADKIDFKGNTIIIKKKLISNQRNGGLTCE